MTRPTDTTPVIVRGPDRRTSGPRRREEVSLHYATEALVSEALVRVDELDLLEHGGVGLTLRERGLLRAGHAYRAALRAATRPAGACLPAPEK